MTYRRRTLQRARPDDENYRLTKQNHNVSCILYKPQRLRNQTDGQSTPKQEEIGLHFEILSTYILRSDWLTLSEKNSDGHCFLALVLSP